MNPHLHINGLHLWAVKTEPAPPEGGTLWITSRRKDAGVAIHKAKAFIRRVLKQNWIQVNILSITHEGTLDA